MRDILFHLKHFSFLVLFLSQHVFCFVIFRLHGKEALKVLLEAPLTLNIADYEDEWCSRAVAAIVELKDPSVDLKQEITTLQPIQLDALLRAVYRGLEPVSGSKLSSAEQKQQDANYQSLLKLHGVVIAQSGLGSISRYLCDRPASLTSAGDNDA